MFESIIIIMLWSLGCVYFGIGLMFCVASCFTDDKKTWKSRIFSLLLIITWFPLIMTMKKASRNKNEKS